MSDIKAILARKASSGGTVYDLGIVGGGIIGLATAQEISWRHPHIKVDI